MSPQKAKSPAVCPVSKSKWFNYPDCWTESECDVVEGGWWKWEVGMKEVALATGSRNRLSLQEALRYKDHWGVFWLILCTLTGLLALREESQPTSLSPAPGFLTFMPRFSFFLLYLLPLTAASVKLYFFLLSEETKNCFFCSMLLSIKIKLAEQRYINIFYKLWTVYIFYKQNVHNKIHLFEQDYIRHTVPPSLLSISSTYIVSFTLYNNPMIQVPL